MKYPIAVAACLIAAIFARCDTQTITVPVEAEIAAPVPDADPSLSAPPPAAPTHTTANLPASDQGRSPDAQAATSEAKQRPADGGCVNGQCAVPTRRGLFGRWRR